VRVALVIDDLGRDFEPLAALARLAVPVTYAVLPFEPRTREVAARLEASGAEVLCHLPMESEGEGAAEPRTLRLAMSDAALAAATAAALDEVPGAVGLNNHQGSLLTTDRRAMRIVLGVAAERQLYFLDSRTTPASVAFAVARELDVRAAERQIFLDDVPTVEAVRREFARLLEVAATRGAAIAIGHPHPATLAALAEEVPRAKASGIEFVPVSALLSSADSGG